MDTELARTFLTVVAAGNFIKAAERLHVTQSTVSARIHSLEQQLGCTLFVRNKAGTTLTPAGGQFQKHASTLVRTVEQARQDVGIPRGFTAAITVGGRFGLWDQLLLDWLPRMRALAPDISVRAEIGFEQDLMQGLVAGRIDIGVMYTPQSRPGLTVEPLIEERLVLVSTEKKAPPGRDRATSISIGDRSSMPSTARASRTSPARPCRPTSAGSACITSYAPAGPGIFRSAWCTPTSKRAPCRFRRTRRTSRCRPTWSTPRTAASLS